MSEQHDNPGDADSRRKALKPWPKGVSGNPGGRRRKSTADRQIENLAREASADAFNTVRGLMTSADSDRTRLAAALAIIERAHGKPGELLAEPVESPEATTLAEQAQAVMQAALAGRVTPTQANALLSGLASVARIKEVTELEERIAALEAQKGPTP
jgi:hypothetical protein